MELPTPKEISDELLNNAFLTEDQANTIASDVYQPLKDGIEATQKAVLRLTACLALELGAETAKSIIKELDT